KTPGRPIRFRNCCREGLRRHSPPACGPAGNEPPCCALRARKRPLGDFTMPAVNTLSDLFHDTLRDVYWAEKHLLKALPKMAKKASSPELAKAIEKHRAETEGHVERLEQVFGMIDK